MSPFRADSTLETAWPAVKPANRLGSVSRLRRWRPTTQDVSRLFCGVILGTAQGNALDRLPRHLATRGKPINTETAKRSHVCLSEDRAARLVPWGGPVRGIILYAQRLDKGLVKNLGTGLYFGMLVHMMRRLES